MNSVVYVRSLVANIRVIARDSYHSVTKKSKKWFKTRPDRTQKGIRPGSLPGRIGSFTKPNSTKAIGTNHY